MASTFLNFSRKYLLLSTALCMTASPVIAQEATDEEDEDDPFHAHLNLEEVIVTASPIGRQRFDVLQSTAVLDGDQLEEEMGGNLGEILDHLPGISNSYFGPGAGRPVIRGLSGDRIRILIGGIGSIDASSTSPDHAVAVDPLTANRIEVIRGPATLLYGNNAVGGVVNILDGRIPFEKPENGFSAAARALYATNANEVSLATSVDAEIAKDWVFHFDGSWRDAGDIDIPGFQRSLAERLAEPLDDDEEEAFGVAENSSLENYSYSAGLSHFVQGGFFGVSVTKTNNNYGIPGGHEEHEGEEEEEHEEEGGVRIDLDQLRIDFMGAINADLSIFETVRVRFGYGDYEHVELEGDEIGTIFLNDGWEGRIELVQKESQNLSGAMGVQVRRRNFSAIGDEAFVPPSTTTQYGFFVMEEYGYRDWNFQGGVRIEIQDVSAPSLPLSRTYTGISISGGASRYLGDDFLIGVTAHRTERAPNAEELFSNGPHIATNTFEIGDPTLGEEVAWGGEISLRKRNGPLTGSITFFYTRYNNFIFEDFTGAEMDGLPVALFRASDVSFHGGELEFAWEVLENNGTSFIIDGSLDFVKAEEQSTDTPLPRIPPLSGQIGLEASHDIVTGRVEFVWADSQNRIADNELPTSGFFAVDASLAIRPFGNNKDITLLLQGRNLNNEEIRHHTSFLKELVPAPGRSVRFSVLGRF